MNRENIQKVRDVIAGVQPAQFTMAAYIGRREAAGEETIQDYGRQAGDLLHTCGTCGCIAGWAAAVANPATRYDGARDVATDFLGLDDDRAIRLFHPHPVENWEQVQPAQAVRVLNHLLETGEVDWSIIDKPEAA